MVIPSDAVVDLSRSQFAMTALFHFLFVPLTLGLSWVMVAMEAAYLKTGNIVYRDMTRFFAKLFAINFAMGVVTGITLEFEFGQNWAYFSRYVGDAFGPVLAIEGLTAFMLEATLFGVFMFGWNKLGKKTHFLVTIFLAIGTNLSIVNILAANSWMQHPEFSVFNYHTMHMHLTNLAGLYWMELTQIRIGHVAMAGFCTGGMFTMGVSAYYLLKKQDVGFAKRAFAIGAGFTMVALLASALFGDANGLAVAKDEPAKMAAIEAQWTTQEAPAAWDLIAFPSNKTESNGFEIKIPWALSLITSHDLTGTVEGLTEVMATNKTRIESGMIAYNALKKIRSGNDTPFNEKLFAEHQKDLGFGMLLKRYVSDDNVIGATPEQINQATKDSIPDVATPFWAFRVMIGFWGLMFLLVVLGCIYTYRGTLANKRGYLRIMLWSMPMPWLAAEAGWVVTEVGRQPWTVHGILPTFMSTSSVGASTVAFSLIGFVLFYSMLFVVEMYLMFKYARLGPSALGEGRYHFEDKTTGGSH